MDKIRATILHMIETTGPGGAETVLLNIVRGLPREEFESIVVVTDIGWLHESLVAANVPTVILKSDKPNDWRFLLEVIRLIRRHSVSLVHSHLDGTHFYACLAGMLSHRSVIATYHGTVGDWYRKSLKNKLKWAVVKREVYRAVAVAEFIKNELIRVWAFPPDRIQRIYNGIDFAIYEAADGRSLAQSSLGLPKGVPVVGMVGNIRKPKGYQHYVRAARAVVDRKPECRFLIIGQGEGELLAELKVLIRTLHLERNVILTGFRPDIPQLLQLLDVFVLSSVPEGLPVAAIEAMGLGRPVVVTDCGGLRELVEDGITGFIVPPAEPEGLATRILQLLNNRELADRLGKQARVAVRDKFSLERNVGSYMELYRNCLRGHSTDYTIPAGCRGLFNPIGE